MHSFFRKSADKIESKRLQYYKTVPFRRLWPLYAAVFCLFAVTGFFGDLMNLGRMPHVVVILNAIFSGMVALMYLHVGVRLELRYYLYVSLLQIPIWTGFSYIVSLLMSRYHLKELPTSSGIRFAGVAMLLLIIVSYSLLSGSFREKDRSRFALRMSLSLLTEFKRRLCRRFSYAPHSSSFMGGLTRATRSAEILSTRFRLRMAARWLISQILPDMVCRQAF